MDDLNKLSKIALQLNSCNVRCLRQIAELMSIFELNVINNSMQPELNHDIHLDLKKSTAYTEQIERSDVHER